MAARYMDAEVLEAPDTNSTTLSPSKRRNVRKRKPRQIRVGDKRQVIVFRDDSGRGVRGGIWFCHIPQKNSSPLRIEVLRNGQDKLRRTEDQYRISVRIISVRDNSARAVVFRTEEQICTGERRRWEGTKARKKGS